MPEHSRILGLVILALCVTPLSGAVYGGKDGSGAAEAYASMMIRPKQSKDASQDQGPDELEKAAKKAGEHVSSVLRDENTWKEAARSDEKALVLEQYLELVGVVPCRGIEKILTENICFTRYDGLKERVVPPDELHPVTPALVRLGLQAVPELLNLLKMLDPKIQSMEDTFDGYERKLARVLAARVLIRIYEKGGFGKSMARKRIELELSRIEGKDKSLLQKALDLPALKTE